MQSEKFIKSLSHLNDSRFSSVQEKKRNQERSNEAFYTLSMAAKASKDEIPVYDDAGSQVAVYHEEPVYENTDVLFVSSKKKPASTDDGIVYAELDHRNQIIIRGLPDQFNKSEYATVVVHSSQEHS